jgi:hypothetical protein
MEDPIMDNIFEASSLAPKAKAPSTEKKRSNSVNGAPTGLKGGHRRTREPHHPPPPEQNGEPDPAPEPIVEDGNEGSTHEMTLSEESQEDVLMHEDFVVVPTEKRKVVVAPRQQHQQQKKQVTGTKSNQNQNQNGGLQNSVLDKKQEPTTKIMDVQNPAVFICTDHDGMAPVSPVTIVVARSDKEAIKLIDEQLALEGLQTYHEKKYHLQELKLVGTSVRVLSIRTHKLDDTTMSFTKVFNELPSGSISKVFTCIDHDTMYPIPPASIVIAPDEETAQQALSVALEECGARSYELHPFTVCELDLSECFALSLSTGEPGGRIS